MIKSLIVSLVCWISLPSVVTSADFIISGIPDGKYILEVVGNKITIKSVPVVTINDPGPGPGPISDPLQKLSADLGNQVADPTKAETATAIATVYREVSKLVQENNLKMEAYPTSTNMMYGPVMRHLKKTTVWTPWKEAMDKATEDLSSVEAYAVAWEEIAKGLEAVQ